jgi:hypothetical protein
VQLARLAWLLPAMALLVTGGHRPERYTNT